MLERIQNVRERFTTPSEPDDDGADPALVPLQLATAQLLLLTGVGAALDSIGRRPAAPASAPGHPLAFERPPLRPRTLATALAPALVGPLAA
ncbi:MAG TPA: hypothetical protein VFI96_01040, partial [Longimicrobiaceae bacterium]|nr:hypothetical protein [Longimicrobiaceae bacterium]